LLLFPPPESPFFSNAHLRPRNYVIFSPLPLAHEWGQGPPRYPSPPSLTFFISEISCPRRGPPPARVSPYFRLLRPSLPFPVNCPPQCPLLFSLHLLFLLSGTNLSPPFPFPSPHARAPSAAEEILFVSWPSGPFLALGIHPSNTVPFTLPKKLFESPPIFGPSSLA